MGNRVSGKCHFKINGLRQEKNKIFVETPIREWEFECADPPVEDWYKFFEGERKRQQEARKNPPPTTPTPMRAGNSVKSGDMTGLSGQSESKTFSFSFHRDGQMVCYERYGQYGAFRNKRECLMKITNVTEDTTPNTLRVHTPTRVWIFQCEDDYKYKKWNAFFEGWKEGGLRYLQQCYDDEYNS